MIQEIFTGIYKIEVPLPKNPLRMLNSYLIRGKERHLLVDTGFNRSECFDALTGALRELGAERGKIDLFLTHLHADHCGLAADLPEDPAAKFYCSERDTVAMNNTTRGPSFWDGFLLRMLPHGISEQQIEHLTTSHPARRFCPSHEISTTPVNDGDVLHYGGYALQVLSTPGHTPGHVSLYEPGLKAFFSGDLILGDITPNIATWENFPDALGTYLNTLERIRGMDIALTLPGHRSLIEDTGKRIDQLQKHHAARLNEVRKILDEGAATAYQTAARMTWDMRYDTWEEFPIPQQWFATCEALSHLEHLVALGEATQAAEKNMILFSRKN